MSLSSPLVSQFIPLTLSTSFLHGTSHLTKQSSFTTVSTATCLPTIRAMRTLQGKVVCATSDKTVAVEVVRLAPHPKYKRRIRLKKKYQAHDPDNLFKVGHIVQLHKSRPISKTKTFLAVPVPAPAMNHKPKDSQDLALPLQPSIQPSRV